MVDVESAATDFTAPLSPSNMPIVTVKPTAFHPLPEDTLVLQNTRSSADSVTSAQRSSNANASESNDARHQLPKRAPDEDAQAARDKLDRIIKAQKTRRNWAKSTGVTMVSKAFGRNQRRQRRRRHGLSSDEESDEQTHKDDDDDRKDNMDEVKLMITGNPVVTRVFDAANRAKEHFRGQFDSPEASPRVEEAAFRFSISRPASSLARRFRAPSTEPPPDSGLKSANLSPAAEMPARASIEANAAALDRPRSRIRPNLAPELLVVDEEGQSHEFALEIPTQSPSRRPTIPFSRSINNTTPNTNISDPPSSSPHFAALSPYQNKQHRGSSPSITAGQIYDEPDPHDHDPAHRVRTPTSTSSASDASSDDELDDSALASDTDEEGDHMLQINSLSLEHGETLTKEEIKRRKKLVHREIRRRKANGEPIDDLIHLHGKFGQLSHKVSKRVSKGIHYASSQRRNRRAMDRFSPHPAQLSLQTADLARSTSAQSVGGMTPFSSITPSVSRNSNHFGQRRESIATVISSRRSSMTMDEEDADPHNADGRTTPRRSSIIDRSILSSRNSIRKYLHAPNVIKRRRQRKWEAELAALEHAAQQEARQADPDAELDSLLAKQAQLQAPCDAHKIKYEFDVLYENQRGLLVFGIPKFSPRTLFQWDPSPWTSASGKKSAYNIANAQLPDPSWEWAYSEWYIDMTGDVDEAGWQYSGNFGRRFWPNIYFPHGRLGLPKTGVEGIQEMNARLAEKEKKRKQKESTKEDGGFEAIKRSARARSSKWTGSPDAWTFVRRRRWIRLRRRKPLASATKLNEALPTPATTASPAQEISVPDSATKLPRSPRQTGAKPGLPDEERQEESPLGSSDESDSSSSEDDPTLFAPAYGGASGFLPRRLPGHMANGSHPARSKDPRSRRKERKHAREFTGTIRELKSLLPCIIAMDREARVGHTPTSLSASQNSYKWAMLKINKVDARNPFISWHLVKQRLQDEDMAIAATTLRTLERKFQQRQLAAMHKREEVVPQDHLPIPSSFQAASKSIRFDGIAEALDCAADAGAGAVEGANANAGSTQLLEPFAQTSSEGHELTREALVEINFARVLRVLRACRLDRQRMGLWKLWLGVISLDSLMETARREDLAALGLLSSHTEYAGDALLATRAVSPAKDAIPHMSGGSSFRYRQRAERVRARWRASVPTPDASDVWDLLERKLDDVLLLFEFQSNRAKLIRLLLAVHQRSHPDHVYRDHSLRANPLELSPAHVHGDAPEMGGPPGGASSSRLGGWKRARLPRLDFYSDLLSILAATPGNEATTNSEYILSQPQEEVAMPLAHHSSANALIDTLEAQAVSDSFLHHENIPSGSNSRDAGQDAAVEASRLSARGIVSTSRSPSPVVKGQAGVLPYRKSRVVSGSSSSLAAADTRSLSEPVDVAESMTAATVGARSTWVHSHRPNAPQDAAKGLQSPSALASNDARSSVVSSALPAQSTRDSDVAATGKAATSRAQPATHTARTVATQASRSPRPRIPTSARSVSPQTPASERF